MDFLRLSLIRTGQILRNRVPFCSTCSATSQKHKCRTRVAASFHSTSYLRGLGEFFEDPNEVDIDKDKATVGRPWRVDELRIKSNDDLHKLWYVLLKERNMLLTMGELYKEKHEAMPSPERIDKVEESMENILSVVKERDIAYNVLETGTTGEQQPYEIRNFVGLPYKRTPTEHYVPKELNSRFNRMHPGYQKWMEPYLRRYDEKMRQKDHWAEKRMADEREKLLQKFPNLTEEDVEHIKPLKKFAD